METIQMGKRRPKTVTVEFVFDSMDLAIADCQSAGSAHSGPVWERGILRAKEAYRDALLLAGRLSFNARQVAEFEWRSVQLERMITQLQQSPIKRGRLRKTRE
jgi:hypothetical protein